MGLRGWGIFVGLSSFLVAGLGQEVPLSTNITNRNSGIETNTSPVVENWNWHLQSTFIVQYHPGFSAPYSGPSSMSSDSEVRETLSLDLYAGLRLWRGAEAHADALVWQGHGFSDAKGAEAFPNGEAFRLGTDVPNINLARLFVRQEVALGEVTKRVESGPLQLAGQRSSSRLVVTIGKVSAKDIFDQNSYANDPRTQFMSWGLMANEGWDYPADSLGYITGTALELYLNSWCLRYGFFQMPRTSNGTALDTHFLQAWGMVWESERRFSINDHPGCVRVLGFWNRANMGSFQEAIDSPVRPADIQATRDYRSKYGFGLNIEQELVNDLGAFLRLSWNNGQTEPWVFADVDHTLTSGLSLKGSRWGRSDDVIGLAAGADTITRVHREFLAQGGTGILAGDGNLTYGPEYFLETYYNARVFSWLQFTLDYQFISHPAYNRDRGPVSVFSARLHCEL